MVDILIYIVILCIIFGLLYYIVTLLPLPEPFKKIALIVLLLIFVILLLGALLGQVSLPRIAR